MATVTEHGVKPVRVIDQKRRFPKVLAASPAHVIDRAFARGLSKGGCDLREPLIHPRPFVFSAAVGDRPALHPHRARTGFGVEVDLVAYPDPGPVLYLNVILVYYARVGLIERITH